ncbi:LacI family DNA-binding transcriptional regulator [Butyrivibrio sp. NC2007]|uniref:LacI family DNA-binding transcriptional regulator n=1 Tax=Butyrivibrio sp. NC2007 TaxID=1280683 RepID=UPI0003B4C8EC|nr:LacI family DNA-binding transcriptional regulator [Butyrivibrio sp. NC2007]
MAITGKELAAKLGVSTAAVSMALNNKPGVSTETRKLILETAKENGYDFTRLPVVKSQKNLGNIVFALYRRSGAIITDNPFFSQLTEGISSCCVRSGYYLNVQYLYDFNDVGQKLKDFVSSGCKGIVLLGTEMHKEDLKLFENAEVPVVILDCYFSDYPANYVLINNMQGAYIATEYLIKKKHSQPGYLQSSYPIQNFSERADGFYKAIRGNGMSTSRSIVHKLAPSVDGAYSDMLSINNNGDQLAKCYFADNDLIAAGAIRAFKESGYKVPKDISVIGFDDIPLCTIIEPTLSTIRVPKQQMGEVAAQRLIELIKSDRNVNTKIEVETKLILRDSV